MSISKKSCAASPRLTTTKGNGISHLNVNDVEDVDAASRGSIPVFCVLFIICTVYRFE